MQRTHLLPKELRIQTEALRLSDLLSEESSYPVLSAPAVVEPAAADSDLSPSQVLATAAFNTFNALSTSV